MKILCVVCARKGSTNLKNKNIKLLNNKPLILHTLIQAQKSKLFSKIVVSSDSNKILKISKKHINLGINRPKSLSGDTVPKILAIKHALHKSEQYFRNKFDIVFDLDVTSPLRKPTDIKKAYNLFIKKKAHMLFSAYKSKKNPYFNMIEKKGNSIKLIKKPKKAIFARQKAPKIYELNASIYIWKRKNLLNLTSFYSGKTTIYEMPIERSIDIDSAFDWKLVEFLLKKNN